MLDFQRAGLRQEKLVALAFLLREQANALPLDQRGAVAARLAAFVKAADAFIAAVPGAVAQEKIAYHRNAGECYENGRELGKAGRAYLDAEQFELSAKAFRKAGMFDEAVDVVHQHGNRMDQDVARSILDVARIQFLRQNRVKLVKTELAVQLGHGADIFVSAGKHARSSRTARKPLNSWKNTGLTRQGPHYSRMRVALWMRQSQDFRKETYSRRYSCSYETRRIRRSLLRER